MGSEWQPMAMAPKDGTDVLAYKNGEMFVVYWSAATALWLYATLPNGGCVALDNPSHWRPLPEPPAHD